MSVRDAQHLARMRDHLAHRYFDTAHAILQATVDEDLPVLELAVAALAKSLQPEKDVGRPARTRERDAEAEL